MRCAIRTASVARQLLHLHLPARTAALAAALIAPQLEKKRMRLAVSGSQVSGARLRNLLKKVSKFRNAVTIGIPKPSPSVFRSILGHSGAIYF